MILRPESYDPKYISIEDHGGVSTTQLSITRKPRNKEIEFLVKTSYRHNFRSRRLSKGGRPLSMGGERSKSLSHYQEMCRKLKRSMELKYKNLDNIEREISPRRRKEGFLTDEAFTKAGTKLSKPKKYKNCGFTSLKAYTANNAFQIRKISQKITNLPKTL